MAPELYQEQPIKIDKCNDIWSFACTYREFLSSKAPYDKDHATAMNRLVRKIPPNFTDLNFSIEDVKLLSKCFEIKISDRWKAQDIVNYFTQLIEGE